MLGALRRAAPTWHGRDAAFISPLSSSHLDQGGIFSTDVWLHLVRGLLGIPRFVLLLPSAFWRLGSAGFWGVFAVTRAARRRDRSGVASAGCPLIPWDGAARTGMQRGFGIRVSCGPLLSLPRWDFSPAVFPGRCAVVDGSAPGKGRRERVGFVLNAWCSGII